MTSIMPASRLRGEPNTIGDSQSVSVSTRSIEDLATPALLLDENRMARNIARLRGGLAGLGVNLRPHLKTAKSLEIARRIMNGPAGPATVSTLREAELFAEGGVRDILYAVGIAPGKLERVTALRRRGVDLSVVVDSPDAAHAVAKSVSHQSRPHSHADRNRLGRSSCRRKARAGCATGGHWPHAA
jgi:D-serine deaminase-like pyridoxal phosphate-dependent protein